MPDGGVGQQALDVVLVERGQISNDHGGHGHHGEYVHPVGPHRAQRNQEQAQQQSEGGGFGGDRDVGGDGRGRALIDVRRPLVERNRRYLEKEGGGNRDGRQKNDGVVQVPLPNCLRYPIDVGGPADAVEQRKPVRQDAGGEHAQEKVFDGGFVRAPIAPEKTGEQVEGDGHQFQTNEEGDEVNPAGQQHHADSGEEDERVVLALVFLFDLQVANGHQDDQGGGEKKNKTEINKKRVNYNQPAAVGPAKGQHGAVVQAPDLKPAERHAQKSGDGADELVARVEQEVQQQNAAGEDGQLKVRDNRNEVFRLEKISPHQRSAGSEGVSSLGISGTAAVTGGASSSTWRRSTMRATGFSNTSK